MAVYCGVCAGRVSCAWENGGSFQVTSEFLGWSPKVSDTCESCARILSEAITKAANKIVLKNRKAVDALQKDVETENARAERVKKEKAEFEREWAERKAKIT